MVGLGVEQLRTRVSFRSQTSSRSVGSGLDQLEDAVGLPPAALDGAVDRRVKVAVRGLAGEEEPVGHRLFQVGRPHVLPNAQLCRALLFL